MQNRVVSSHGEPGKLVSPLPSGFEISNVGERIDSSLKLLRVAASDEMALSRTTDKVGPTPVADGNMPYLRPYARPLPALRTGALYNAFSYPTKISPETIAILIANHTEPGATVLDVFGGSGTTGLAALLCDRPTELMHKMVADMQLPVSWGPRNAVIQDVGVLGSFVSDTMCNPPDPLRFLEAAEQMLASVEADLGHPYDVTDTHGAQGTIRHVIWTEILACPLCTHEATYWDSAVRRAPLRLLSVFECPKCSRCSPMGDVPRARETVFDPLLGQEVTRRRRVPAQVYGRTDSTNWQRVANYSDGNDNEALLEHARHLGPIVPIQWGELRRTGYHTGITHLHHFYTARNFGVMAAIWLAAERADEAFRSALRLLALSYNASHSTLMTRVVIKGGKELVVTGSQSGVLYVSGLPVEKNLFRGMRRKAEDLRAAFALVHGSRSQVQVVNASSVSVPLPDGSVDYVFTDPPFGDYIPYAEVNQINEAWLGRLTEQRDEITISPSQGRSVSDYGALLAEVFAEVRRVMRDDARATVVFHSAKAEVWRALASAYEGAGLQVDATGVLDKRQSSFKQVVSSVAVKGDPLILLSKADGKSRTHTLREEDILNDVLSWGAQPDHQNVAREMLYSRFVARCVAVGLPLRTDASSFYAEATRQGIR